MSVLIRDRSIILLLKKEKKQNKFTFFILLKITTQPLIGNSFNLSEADF